MQRVADVLFWILVSLWLAFAISGGVAAMAIFPAARELPLSLEGYEGFLAASPEQGRMLVAGHLAEQVFALTERARLVLAPLTVLAMLAQFALVPRPVMVRKRLAAVFVAAAALLAGAFWSQPAFSARDAEYRAAARAGRVEEANTAKAAVDAAHERASRIATTEILGVLVLIVLSAWSAGGGTRRG